MHGGSKIGGSKNRVDGWMENKDLKSTSLGICGHKLLLSII